ncbi:MAG: hypothetical protein FJY29_04590 [Betaproteobacteria bacterium]|nr:hypothetical protein [Betaproteobacteria bacterium]
MRVQSINNLIAVSLVSLMSFGQALARPNRPLASNEKTRTLVAQNEGEEMDDAAPVNKPKKKFKQTVRSSEPASQEGYWYARIQQLPLLGLAAVSDTGVIDIELMKVVNPNFHIGPTAVYHFGKQQDTKMQSLNLGVRADLILNEVGNMTDLYLSTALMFGLFESTTKKYDGDLPELLCDFREKGYHRVGAFAVGKLWNLSESVHVTTGIGTVKTKTSGSIEKDLAGQCQRSITESDGTTLPWFDFGVGFRL